MRRKKFMHFSHHHPLHETNVKEDDGVVCSCCWLGVTGPGFKCKLTECGFLMHKSCTELPQHMPHKSHPAHILTLTLVPNGNFICDACGGTGAGFTYRCSVCDYDIHVKCSSLPETIKREEHEHPVSLHYSMVYDNDDVEFVCDVCERYLKHGCWVYYCKDCDFGIHLDCSIAESKETNQREDEKEEKVEGSSSVLSYDPVALMNAQIRAQEQLQLNQMRMQTSYLEALRQRDQHKNFLKLIG